MRDLLARNRVLKNSGIADTRSNTPPGAEIEHLRKSQAPLSSHPKLRSRPCWRGHSYVSLIDRQVTVMAFQKVPPLDFLIYFIYLSLSWLPKILKPCQIPSSGLFTSPCLIWSVANSSQIIPFHFSPLLPRLALFLIQTFIFLICTLSYSNLLYQWLQPVLGSLHQIHLWALHIQFIL